MPTDVVMPQMGEGERQRVAVGPSRRVGVGQQGGAFMGTDQNIGQRSRIGLVATMPGCTTLQRMPYFP